MRMFRRNRTTGTTIIELVFAVGLFVLLSTSLYQILRMVRTSFTHSRNKLDILQTTRIIMSGIRNELRNADNKPLGDGTFLRIPISPTEEVLYHFDKDNLRLYRGKKLVAEPDPAPKELRPFLFSDGQILDFDYTSSYRDSNAFVESELALNSKVWFKVSMKILYTEKLDRLSEDEKAKVIANPDEDPRVKSFFMMITPRKVNWLLQATQ